MHIAMQFRHAPRRAAIPMRNVQIALPAWICAIGEEGQCRGVRRPDEFAFTAVLTCRCGRGNAFTFAEIADGRNANLRSPARTFNPGQPFAVRRDSNLAEKVAAVEAGQHLVDEAVVRRLGILSWDGVR